MATKKPAVKDPWDGSQGTITFKKQHPDYGNSYTDRADKVKKAANDLKTSGYTIGKTGLNMWTVKDGPKKKGKK